MKENAALGKLCDIVFFTFVGTFYAWALSKSLFAATILYPPYQQMLLTCGVLVLLLNIVFWNRRTMLVTLGLLILAAGGLMLYLFLQGFEVPWFVELLHLLQELNAFIREYGPYREEFSSLAAWGVAFLFSLAFVLNTRLHYSFITMSLMAAAVIIVPIHMGLYYSPTAIIVMLFCLLAMLAKRLYLNALSGQGSAHGFSRYALLLLPLCMLMFGVGWLLPKPDAETVEQMDLLNVADTIDNILHAIVPDQAVSFTDDGRRLGGPVNQNDLVVMIVEADERLYLAGVIRDYYTGYSWLTTQLERTDLVPDENGVFDIAGHYPEELRRAQDFFRRFYGWQVRQVTITAGDVRTNAIFTPPSSQTLELEHELPITQDVYGILRSGRVLPRETSYTLSYIGWNMSSPHFSHILREFAAANSTMGATQGESGAVTVRFSALLSSAYGLTPEELAPFLQLPDSLPRRVRDLAGELTYGLNNNYDRLRAIERFLAGFPYTLDAPHLPEGEDFVDHFLFTAQQGYCVHYATAMVVMARSIGIPARYVEGYIMPERPAGDGRWWVTNRYAHAWVEAYFEGFGWARFEPTAAFRENGGGYTVFEEPEEGEDPDEYREEPIYWEGGYPDDHGGYVYVYGPTTPEEYESPERGASLSLWRILLVLAVLAGLGFLAYHKLIARYLRKQRGLEKLPNREAVLALFASTLNAAQASGCPIFPGETALGYADRVAAQPFFAGQGLDIRQLAGIYSKAAYSNHQITAWERAAAQKIHDAAMRHLTVSPKNIPRYWVERYILLRY